MLLDSGVNINIENHKGKTAWDFIQENIMEKGDKEWRKLAFAFYSLAHNDFKDFSALEPELKITEAGRLCSEYIKTKNHDLIEKAGYLLTDTKQWYVYLGRIM